MIPWAQNGKASVLVGGQFGSEGKGLIAAWLAHYGCPTGVQVATTNAGAQAGHTTRYRNDPSFVCYHLPTIGVVNPDCAIYINAGSIIDIEQLKREIMQFEGNPDRVRGRLVIHPKAAIITAEDKAAAKDIKNSVTAKLGATGKGVGHTLSRKVLRQAMIAEYEPRLAPFVNKIDLNEMLRGGGVVTVEIPQGTGLGLNHGYEYPHTTNRDCWVGAGLADAGIHPSFIGNVCMVVRTFPIRVGHVIGPDGEMIGHSGPFYPDSRELNWEDDFPLVEPERTTVTKRVRRIASWSWEQYEAALRLNRPRFVALTFCDYFKTPAEFRHHLGNMVEVEDECGLPNVTHIFSVGPNVEDVLTNGAEVSDWLEKRVQAQVKS